MGSRWDIYAGGGSYLGAICPSPRGTFRRILDAETGHGDIYRFDRATGKNIRLTDEREYDGYPVFSGDGRHVLFEHETNGISHLYIMDADGRNRRRSRAGRLSTSGPHLDGRANNCLLPRSRWRLSHLVDECRRFQFEAAHRRTLVRLPPLFSRDSRRIIFMRKERGAKIISPRPRTRRPCHAGLTRSTR